MRPLGRRVSLAAALLLAESCLGVGLVQSAAPPAAAAASEPAQTAVVTTTVAVAGYTTGSETWWYSASGTTGVSTVVNSAGQVESIERVAYGISHHRLTQKDTVVFPQQRAWATYSMIGEVCPESCHADNWLYGAPSVIRRFLAQRILVATGHRKRLNGRNVEEFTLVPQLGASNLARTESWIDPADDEIVQQVTYPPASMTSLPPEVQNYQWFRGTKANLAHLTVNVPSGYEQVSNGCAEPVGDPVPPGLGAGDPCS